MKTLSALDRVNMAVRHAMKLGSVSGLAMVRSGLQRWS